MSLTTDPELDLTSDGRQRTTQTEHRANRHNHTGYPQTTPKTAVEASGAKTIPDDTFGHDEISLRVRDYTDDGQLTSDDTLLFGHAGHCRVRVLYDLGSTAERIPRRSPSPPTERCWPYMVRPARHSL